MVHVHAIGGTGQSSVDVLAGVASPQSFGVRIAELRIGWLYPVRVKRMKVPAETPHAHIEVFAFKTVVDLAASRSFVGSFIVRLLTHVAFPPVS